MKEFTPDCILVVLASEHYNESDYIRDYDKFLKVANNDKHRNIKAINYRAT